LEAIRKEKGVLASLRKDGKNFEPVEIPERKAVAALEGILFREFATCGAFNLREGNSRYREATGVTNAI